MTKQNQHWYFKDPEIHMLDVVFWGCPDCLKNTGKILCERCNQHYCESCFFDKHT